MTDNATELVKEIDTLLAHWIGCDLNKTQGLPSEVFPHIFRLLHNLANKGKQP